MKHIKEDPEDVVESLQKKEMIEIKVDTDVFVVSSSESANTIEDRDPSDDLVRGS